MKYESCGVSRHSSQALSWRCRMRAGRQRDRHHREDSGGKTAPPEKRRRKNPRQPQKKKKPSRPTNARATPPPLKKKNTERQKPPKKGLAGSSTFRREVNPGSTGSDGKSVPGVPGETSARLSRPRQGRRLRLAGRRRRPPDRSRPPRKSPKTSRRPRMGRTRQSAIIDKAPNTGKIDPRAVPYGKRIGWDLLKDITIRPST